MIGLITGARKGERGKTLASFLALFFLLLSYSLIKPLRNSQFLKDFDPAFLPLVYLGVAVLSLIVTKVFNLCYERMDRYRLIVATYGVLVACKVGFHFLLREELRTGTIAFYFWASVYFLLALAALWACINDIFTAEQSERCFGFVALGATLGGIAGSELSEVISQGPLGAYPTLLSAAAMLVALGFILVGARHAARQQPLIQAQPVSAGVWSDLVSLWRTPYVRAIGIMVFALAVYNTAVDFTSQRQLDVRLAEQQYALTYPGGRDFSEVYHLKSLPAADRARWLRSQGRDPEPILRSYDTYRQELEKHTRARFSRIYKFQNVLGMIMLGIVSRFLFARCGLGVAVCLMPLFALASLVSFMFPLGLVAIEGILIFGGALNYSLNNATKEILYTATSRETKFKHKPLIEGPGLRLGDVVAALLKLATQGAERLFLLLSAGLVTWWLVSIRSTGREYDRLRSDRPGS